MKKIMVLGIAVIVLVGTLWFGAGSATAAGTITYTGSHFVWGKGIAFIFEASGYRNRDVKNASLMIGSSSFDVHCTVNKDDGKIICVAGGGLTQYAGDIGILTVAGHSFYVRIPNRPPVPSVNGNVPLSCPPGTEPGADVFFNLPGEGTWTRFIGGSTLSEVSQNAENTGIVEFGGSYDVVSPLYCSGVD